MTDTRSYQDVSTDPPERERRPSDLVADDLPEVELDDQSDQVDERQLLEDIEEALKDVVDPELGINVVDLGLVYGLHLEDDDSLTIDMTLTSAACPLTDVIEDQARQALTGGPGPGLVDDIRINWVWMPPWGPDKITDDGREQLRALGFRV
jgi:metal-sulfur cluster biosynthetic enzyme